MRTEPSFSEDSDNPLGETDPSVNALSSRFDQDSSLVADYRQRYGLSTDPFVDDPHFPFYQGAQRRQILEQLLHLCQFSQNLLLITGDYGVGKTRMAQALIDALDDADDICFVEGQINSDIDSILADVCEQLELVDRDAFTHLCLQKSGQDGLVVLIVDNAHHLSDEVILDLIELLREGTESRLHLVLFAEPHLLSRLEAINVPDVVLTDFSLEKFSLIEAVDYLNFRMEMADYLGPEIFVESKVESWWRQSQGQLLQLHEHAHQSLLEAVSKPQRSRSYLSQKRGLPIPHIVAASALVGGLFFWFLYQDRDASKLEDAKVTSSIPVVPQQAGVISSQAVSVQASSIAAPNSAALISSEAAQSLASSSSASQLSAAQPKPKESVVPLVKTSDLVQSNETENGAAKQSRSSSVSSLKSSKKAELSSELAKITVKAETDPTLVGKSKSADTYSDQEKAILGWDATGYTLQLVGLSNEKAAHEFIAAQPNKKELLLFKSRRAGKDWFVVVTGRYASSSKARQAVQELTEAQRKAAPWPREIKVIQQEIKQR
ncbi:AAA family ATPase [Cellvibrio sp.]|uniref:AAA family ATPase n=1 Tax=Cellvibrio sp. TaxID=1965322 RepID=UPI0039647965